MARKPAPALPFPFFVPFPSRCPACMYDLAGADKLDRCPECGTPIAIGVDCLAIAAVPRRTPGPVWRRVAWTLIAVVFVILSQTWPLIGFRWPWLLGLLFLACVAAAVAMVLTGTPVSKTTERIVFTPFGFVRSVWGKDESTMHPWTGDERVRTKRIGTVWQRLTIEQHGEKALECGLRCRDAKLAALAACIERYANHGLPDEESIRLVSGTDEGAAFSGAPA